MLLPKLIFCLCLFSLDVHNFTGPNVEAYPCNGGPNQVWTWNSADQTLLSKSAEKFLTYKPQLEIWAGPLSDGSQAVLLFNRVDSGSSPITVQWTDIGFSATQQALVRDLWQHNDVGTFTGSYTSPSINAHAVQMLKITPSK